MPHSQLLCVCVTLHRLAVMLSYRECFIEGIQRRCCCLWDLNSTTTWECTHLIWFVLPQPHVVLYLPPTINHHHTPVQSAAANIGIERNTCIAPRRIDTFYRVGHAMTYRNWSLYLTIGNRKLLIFHPTCRGGLLLACRSVRVSDKNDCTGHWYDSDKWSDIYFIYYYYALKSELTWFCVMSPGVYSSIGMYTRSSQKVRDETQNRY